MNALKTFKTLSKQTDLVQKRKDYYEEEEELGKALKKAWGYIYAFDNGDLVKNGEIEKLANLDLLPDFGFKTCCIPIKIEKAGAAWARPVAFLED